MARGEVLTPGLTATNVNPSLANVSPYSAVIEFRAALVILYDGVNIFWNCGAIAIDPTDDELDPAHVSFGVLIP